MSRELSVLTTTSSGTQIAYNEGRLKGGAIFTTGSSRNANNHTELFPFQFLQRPSSPMFHSPEARHVPVTIVKHRIEAVLQDIHIVSRQSDFGVADSFVYV